MHSTVPYSFYVLENIFFARLYIKWQLEETIEIKLLYIENSQFNFRLLLIIEVNFL